MKKKTWAEFRMFLADVVEQLGDHAHLKRCVELLRDTDYEGPALFNVGCTSIHTLYEEMLEDVEEFKSGKMSDEDAFNEWWKYDGGRVVLRDWIIDTHPGLCPDEVAFLADELVM